MFPLNRQKPRKFRRNGGRGAKARAWSLSIPRIVSFMEPLLGYIEEIIANRQQNETITIVVPQFVPSKRLYNVLHMQTADLLRKELLSKPGVVITDVPYQIP